MWVRLAVIAAAAAAVLALAGVIVFQDNLTRFFANPRAPFQTLTPPPAPDYRSAAAWALLPDSQGGESAADIFYVHSTTFYSNAGWNGPIDDPEADKELMGKAAPNEAGPFLLAGDVYGPRYRQATLFGMFTHKFDGFAARKLAYGDVRRAFRDYLKRAGERRPIVLVGYGQGGLYVQGLLTEFFGRDEDLRARLAAAYIIGHPTPLALFEEDLSATPPCLSPSAIRCVVSYIDLESRFDEEMRRWRLRAPTWVEGGELVSTTDSPPLCVNPLTWTDGEAYAPPEAHRGAASATGLQFGSTPPAIANAVGAKCVGGILEVDKPAQAFLRRGDWFGAKWKAQHFNLFYFDLAADAERRIANAAAKLEEEYFNLDPIEESVDVEISPVNTVPDL